MTRVLQTRFDGCHFRSRLEARWAVFFNHLGIRWEYEPEVYEVNDTRYLPDYWLPDLQVHVEVKGSLEGLQAAVDQLTVMCEGGSPLPGMVGSARPGCTTGLLLLGPIPRATGGRATHWLYQHHKGVCRTLVAFDDTGTLQVLHREAPGRVLATTAHDLSPHLGHPYDYTWAHGEEAAACTAATSARFDNGRPRR